jgi:hypothetical protein
MLDIKINNEALDIAPGTELQMERESPIFQFTDEIQGGYSLPFNVKNTSPNLRLLGYPAVLQRRVTKVGIDAETFDNAIPSLKGKIKIEKVNVDVNISERSDISCYFLTDAADFYQDAKDKKMRAIDVGGDRTFHGEVVPVRDSDFFQHVLNVARGIGGPYDYAFYPVQNSAWGDDPGMHVDNDVMNKITDTEFGMFMGPIVVPFPYLKYVLLQAIAYCGWTIKGDILDDVDFEKITMINFRAIAWGNVRLDDGDVYYIDIYNDVTFNLQNNLPDMTVPEFLIALKNRFGWRLDFNKTERKITIFNLKDILTGEIKDFTRLTAPVIPKGIFQDNKIYALRNDFVTGGGDGIDITKVDYQGEVNKTSDLPGADEAHSAQVYLVIEENNYYICNQNPDNLAEWYWQILAANIFDYEPPGFNEEVKTKATTVEMVRFNDYMDLIPRCDSPGIWTGDNGEIPWGIHLCFWYGPRNNKSDQSIPFASHHMYDSQGFTLAAWSLAFRAFKTYPDHTQVGLYDLNWKPFLELFPLAEEFTIVCNLPFSDYLQLSFTDIIIVDGVRLLIKTIKHTIPYKTQVELVCWRI